MTIQISERFPELTLRQREVCAMLALGRSNKQISRELGISHRTVEDHRRDIFEKLQVVNAVSMLHKICGEPKVIA